MRYPGLVFPFVLVMLAGGCRSHGPTAATGQGSFSASWVGVDTGKLSGRPRALLCTDGNLVQVLASKGDLGVGLAIYPDSSLESGTYEGFDPGVDTTIRPGFSAAARWFTEREIRAFQSDWGTLKLTREGAAYSGSFAAHMRKVGADTDTLVLSGRFSGVMPGPCAGDAVSPPDSTE